MSKSKGAGILSWRHLGTESTLTSEQPRLLQEVCPKTALAFLLLGEVVVTRSPAGQTPQKTPDSTQKNKCLLWPSPNSRRLTHVIKIFFKVTDALVSGPTLKLIMSYHWDLGVYGFGMFETTALNPRTKWRQWKATSYWQNLALFALTRSTSGIQVFFWNQSGLGCRAEIFFNSLYLVLQGSLHYQPKQCTKGKSFKFTIHLLLVSPKWVAFNDPWIWLIQKSGEKTTWHVWKPS